MNIETIKLPVQDLVMGMHVVQLDRPWLETPFKLQGFRIQRREELLLLRQYCKHVYIDIERGVAPPRGKGQRVTLNAAGEVVESVPHMRTQAFMLAGERRRAAAAATRAALPPRAVEYPIAAAFEAELPHAVAAVATAKLALKAFIEDFDRNAQTRLASLRDSAHALEDSMLRNPYPAMLVRALSARESFSFRHGVHSAILGIALARELGLRRQAIHELTMGILLADMGKSRLPRELLRAERRLDGREAEIMQMHVSHAVTMASTLEGLAPTTFAVIASHHERFDGSGYPAGIRGGEIPLAARIAGLVDSLDAVTSRRAYCGPIPLHEVLQELYAAPVAVFQRELVEKLIQVLGVYPVGSMVELSDGVVTVVAALNDKRRLLPKVVLLSDRAKQPQAPSRLIDLAAAEPPVLTVKTILDPGSYGIELPALDQLAS